MPSYMQNDEFASDGVNLLVSLLVRYPEIASLTFEPRRNSITMKFLFVQLADEEILRVNFLEESLAAFYELVKVRPMLCNIQLEVEGKLTVLNVERDVATISKSEIVLLVTILREQIQGLLVSDIVEQQIEEAGFHEELIENMLNSIKSNYGGQGLVGIREEGRVLVFNK